MTITSVVDALERFQHLQGNNPDEEFYFRGESRHFPELSPSVMRDGFADFEGEMLSQFMTRQPVAFQGIDHAFGQWGLAQHYRLRTRFLDISRNPLVGLFHSSIDHRSEQGRLHTFAVPRSLIKPFNSDTVSIIANFAKLPRREQDTILDREIGGSEELYSFALRHLLQLIRTEKPQFEDRIDFEDLYNVFVIEPQQSDERIRAQSGAFLASVFHRRFEREEVLRWNPNIPVYAHHTANVPAASKEYILKELRLLNITRETMFPGLDESARAITEAYRQRFGQV